MRKLEELRSNHSCLHKANNMEMIFVLLARDRCAPAAIRYWCQERIRLGLNAMTDEQILDAMECARIMEEEGPSVTQYKVEE